MAHFPEPTPGIRYLTEGGQETELMYKFGHDLPEFALFTVLDDPRATADLTGMYVRYLSVAAAAGYSVMMGGLDYRASADWGAKLGLSPAQLADYQHRSIQFLRDVAYPFRTQIDQILIAGIIGPRGDAYGTGGQITSAEAEDYHSLQIDALRREEVDVISAMTFNNIPEAVGVARAAAAADLPLSMSFMVDTDGRLTSGHTLREAVEEVDRQTGSARPTFYGINCSHPIEFEAALTPGPWLERIRSLRPNAAVAEKQSLCQIGHLEAGDPDDLARRMTELVDRLPHVDIVGGCCGTWDSHLSAITHQLNTATTGVS